MPISPLISNTMSCIIVIMCIGDVDMFFRLYFGIPESFFVCKPRHATYITRPAPLWNRWVLDKIIDYLLVFILIYTDLIARC